MSGVTFQFDLEDMSAFADHKYTIMWHKDLNSTKAMLKTSISNMSKWLKDSGLKVNDAKTDI